MSFFTKNYKIRDIPRQYREKSFIKIDIIQREHEQFFPSIKFDSIKESITVLVRSLDTCFCPMTIHTRRHKQLRHQTFFDQKTFLASGVNGSFRSPFCDVLLCWGFSRVVTFCEGALD